MHDVPHYMPNEIKDGYKYAEKIGCIEIRDNAFIDANSMILCDVKIGRNVVVAAGALEN